MDQNTETTKCAVEILFDEAGNVLKTERYIFNRAPREGSTFIEDWKEYRTVKAVVTFGKDGAMLEHVVRLVADRTPNSPAETRPDSGRSLQPMVGGEK